MPSPSIMACPECDLLHRIGPLPKEETAYCQRCGAFLRRGTHGSLDIPLAFAITALALFGLANVFPLVELQLHGSTQAATLPGCAQVLISLGWPWLAAILITTVILAPPVYLGGLVYVLIRARLGRPGRRTAQLFRIVQEFQPWGMAEVFILGFLVAYVKLSDMASVRPGFSIYAFAVFILATSSALSSLDPNAVWDALGDRP